MLIKFFDDSLHSFLYPSHCKDDTVKVSRYRQTTYYYYPQSDAPRVSPYQDIDNQYTYITSSATPKMPGIARPKVHFASQDKVCRPAREDERYVMERFAKHASHCSYCSRPYETYLADGYLCERGHSYAKDVAQYVYLKAGVLFSEVEQTSDRIPVQVEIPAKFEVVRELLQALNAGMRKQKPVISYDKTYYVPKRRSYSPEYYYEPDVYETEPMQHHESRRHRSEKKRVVYVPGRGSLYNQDEKDRRKRREAEPVIIYAAPTRSRHKEYYR